MAGENSYKEQGDTVDADYEKRRAAEAEKARLAALGEVRPGMTPGEVSIAEQWQREAQARKQTETQTDKANNAVARASYWNNLANSSQYRSSPTLDYSGADADAARALLARHGQSAGIVGLQRAAAGGGPSAAGALAGQASADAIAASRSAAANARGAGMQALAGGQAVSGAADAVSRIGGQAGAMRFQEQQAAATQLQQALYAQRTQDLMARGLSAKEAQTQAALDDAQLARNMARDLAYRQMGVGAIEHDLNRRSDLTNMYAGAGANMRATDAQSRIAEEAAAAQLRNQILASSANFASELLRQGGKKD